MTPASRAIVMFTLANLVILLVTHVGTLRVNIKKAHAQKLFLPHYLVKMVMLVIVKI